MVSGPRRVIVSSQNSAKNSMANIETMSVKFVWYFNIRPPSEVTVQVSSSKLIEISVKESCLAPTVSPGSPMCFDQVDSLSRKLHWAEKKQNVPGILQGANSSQIKQKIILGS